MSRVLERDMNIHEYQAKNLFKDYGINVLEGGIAYSGIEAVKIAEKIKSDKISGFQHKGIWYDIGNSERLKLAEELFPNN